MNTLQELVQIRKAIDALNGNGFQKQVPLYMPAFGPNEVKTRLEAILSDGQITDVERAEAQQLRVWLREKCEV